MVIDNPRQDAAEVFEVVKNILQGEIAKKQTEVIKMAGAMFNNLLMMRR